MLNSKSHCYWANTHYYFGKEMPKKYSVRIKENYGFFKEWIEDYSDKLEVLCKGIAKLIVVDIALSSDQDNPQLIFESMNSTGKVCLASTKCTSEAIKKCTTS